MSWDFALILFVLLVVTGTVWCLDVLWLKNQRRTSAVAAMGAIEPAVAGLDKAEAARLRQEAYDKANRPPWWVEYCTSFFPVILVVFLLRSFLFEPFRIPSGSMLPTLQNGDLILVNKYEYGIRLPVLDRKIIEVGDPQRGDVVVFRYPVDPSIDYIKRVVGVPGDVVQYRDKVLTINGERVETVRTGDYYEPDRSSYVGRYTEVLGNVQHDILLNRQQRQEYMPISNFPLRDHCEYGGGGVRCTVPAGHYFMMGDNRDNSLDSRYWGFVPDRYIVGRAFMVWMNFSEPSRIGRVK
ncbi:signal peptidase I [Yanghanlia caeni]|uniref:Signal peptidase I n=1 Tax=Yanghanlia caeni TaxID=3064283 RepID=A0ABU1D3P3_9BURK|nr:signal peptidase I [Alcaligenaceae bacterium LG-2]NGR07515.1 signal peptidase I [bacterium SGD-2]HZH57236.1 signal peptidase I [Burkholderiaceae bacterium]